MRGSVEVAIVGAGPSGLALAGALARRGREVVVIDPAPTDPWKPTWSGFEDELPGVPHRHRWARTRVELDRGPLVRARPYVQVDKQTLQQRLLRDAPELLTDRVVAVTPSGLELEGGALEARWVIDCSGTAQVLANNPPPTAFQTAYGIEIETDGGHPWNPDEATWMDLRGLQTPPSFLYAMPYGPDRVFVEETALAWRPAFPIEALQDRLHARLDQLGIRIRSVHETERCRIALDVAPHPHLAFGAAAGLVHPATGYLLARALSLAEPFADALEDPLARSRLLQPRLRRLHLLGLETLLRSDGPATTAFFDTFFRQPDWARDAFLSALPRFWSTTAAMSRIFVSAPSMVKWRLAAPLVSYQEQAPPVAPGRPEERWQDR